MIDLTSVSAVLTKVISPAIEDQFNNKALLYQIAKKNFRVSHWSNDTFYIPLRTSRSAGVIALPDGKSLQHGAAGFSQASAAVKLLTGSFVINKKVLAVKDAGTIAPILTTYSESLTKDLIVDVNRQLWGDGSATIGTVSGATSSSTTVVLAASTNGDITAEDKIFPGQYITDGAGTGAVQVTKVSGNTITVAAAQSYSDGAAIKKVTSDGTPADELTGLGALFNTTTSATYLGLKQDDVPTWAPIVHNVGGALTLTDMETYFSKANKVGDVKYIFMNQTLWNKYGSLLTSQIRFSPKDVLGGGWKGLDFMGGSCKVVLDYEIPDDYVAFISPSLLTIGELQPLQFEKGTNGTLLRESGKLDYEAVESALFNLATFARSGHALLTGVTA